MVLRIRTISLFDGCKIDLVYLSRAVLPATCLQVQFFFSMLEEEGYFGCWVSNCGSWVEFLAVGFISTCWLDNCRYRFVRLYVVLVGLDGKDVSKTRNSLVGRQQPTIPSSDQKNIKMCESSILSWLNLLILDNFAEFTMFLNLTALDVAVLALCFMSTAVKAVSVHIAAVEPTAFGQIGVNLVDPIPSPSAL